MTNEQAHEAFDEAMGQEASFAQEERQTSDHALKASAHQQRWRWLAVAERAAALHDPAACALCRGQ